MKKSSFLQLILFLAFMKLNAQHSLNQMPINANIFNDYYSEESEDSEFIEFKRAIAISDSTFLISGRILMNLDADAYKLTFGLSQQAKSVDECSEIMNERINQFTNSIKKLGISDKDFYVDITTQYPIYGYEVEKRTATQQLEGYEINRNIIIKYEALNLTEKLVNIAAQNGIHDAVKLDYLVSDIESVYNKLFTEATTIIQNKKKLYLAATNLKILDEAMIFREQFQFVSPDELAKTYQAFTSSEIEYLGYNSKRFKEKERKKTTVYYDELDYSGFDKYINSDKIEVGLQVIFELQIMYERVKK